MFQLTESLIVENSSCGIKFGKENDPNFSILNFDKEFSSYEKYALNKH